MPKNIVLCSDGTGNTTILGRGTNVFKLYEAVDLDWSEPGKIDGQVAFYGDGVGTESVKWLRLLTGAFGIGVRRNVKQLYKQLARVYEPGDQIYLFGFSRGSYTVRLLAGVIAQCGIIKSDKLSDSELEGGADAAFDALRSRFFRIFLRKRNQAAIRPRNYVPGAVRRFHANYPCWLPDGCKTHELHPDSSHFANEATGERRPVSPTCTQGVRIRFIGVWDTIVAYGFPLHEVAEFWDRFVYPFRFPDTYLSDIVDHACHALSIDDERATFAPVLWQGRRRPAPGDEPGEIDPRVEQVWFAGVHANVGGGYPKQGMSLVALNWMMKKASQHGLRFIQSDLDYVEKHEDVHDKLYDSRSGFACYYRYRPRDIEVLCEEAGLDRPTLHFSVLERIEARTDEYAPAYVPAKYDVDNTGMTAPYPVECHPHRRLHQLDIVKDVIWWRRVVYYALLFLTLALVVFGWWFGTEERFADVSHWSGPSRGFQVALDPLLNVVDWMTPDSLTPALNSLRQHPLCTSLFAGLFLSVWYLGRGLQDHARELGFRAWRGSLPSLHGEPYPMMIRHPPLLRFAHVVRGLRCSGLVVTVSRYVVPPVFLTAFGLVVMLALCRWLVPAVSLACSSTEPAINRSTGNDWLFTFDTREPLQATPVLLERGQRYRISVVLHTPWRDRELEATPTGVARPSTVQRWAGSLRRDGHYPWFMLLGSVGTDPRTTFAVGLDKTVVPDRDGRLYLFVNDVFGFYHNNDGTAEIHVERLGSEQTFPYSVVIR